MFPVKPFEYHCEEYQLDKKGDSTGIKQVTLPVDMNPIKCSGCQEIVPIRLKELSSDVAIKEYLTCTHCSQNYCVDCDNYIHDILFNCPGCENMHNHHQN